MTSDQDQNPKDINSTHQKKTHRPTKAPEFEEEQNDTERGGSDDGTPGTSGHDAEQVETADAGNVSEGTGIAGKTQESQPESGKSDSATSVAVDDASKRSSEAPVAPEDATPPSSGDAVTSLGKDLAFVGETCGKVGAIDILNNIINDPYNAELRKIFSEAVDRLILERQHQIGNTDNLLLPMHKIASLVINHAKADEKSRLFRTRAEQESSQSLKDAYEKKIQEFEQTKLSLENEWKALLKAKCYPPAWCTKLEASNGTIKVRWKNKEPSVADFREELDKQKALAREIWGVGKIDDVSRPEHLSWALESHNIENGSRKRRPSQDLNSEPQQKKR